MTDPTAAAPAKASPTGEREHDGRSVGRGSQRFAVRKPPTRSWRRIVLRSALALIALALLGGGAYWLRTADTFSVVRVESGSYRFTEQAELEAVLSGFLGRNIWALSNDEVAAAMAPLVWVRDLRVRRRLPAVMEVDFREWRPLVEVAAPAKSHRGSATPPDVSRVLVEDGRVLPFPEHLVLAGLPVLTGVQTVVDSSAAAGAPGAVPVLRLAADEGPIVLDLLRAIENSGLESISPVDFIAVRPEGIAVVLQGDLGLLLVGREEFEDRLQRYMEAHEHLESGLIVDLRFRDRITCRRPETELEKNNWLNSPR